MSVTTAIDAPLRSVIPFRPRCWLYITHGPFGDGTNGQAGIHAQVGSEHRAIADVHVLVPKNAIPMIHHSTLRRTGHPATAQDVGEPVEPSRDSDHRIRWHDQRHWHVSDSRNDHSKRRDNHGDRHAYSRLE